MTIIGLVGGLGPESTIDYYRRILDAWAHEEPDSAPRIVIDSLDVSRALRLVATDRLALIDYLGDSVTRLTAAGASLIAISANTPHIVFDELAALSTVPLVSIVETCAMETQRRSMQRVALLGTRFTMEGSFFPMVFERFGIVLVTPDETDRAWIHEVYVGELLAGEFRDDTREKFTSLIARLRDDERIDGVILGGTELPLLLRKPVVAGVPTLDTTALHVAEIVRLARL